MKSRYARIGVLVIPIMALFASMAPSADARAAGTIAVQGRARVSAGLGYPCVGATTTPDPAKCPATGSGNTVGFTFRGDGAGGVTSVGKAKCGSAAACSEAGTFTISASGTLIGWCGLSSGTGSGVITPVISLGTKSKSRTFTFSYFSGGGTLTITGTTNKGETIAGIVLAVPDPTTGSSCTNKNAKDFIIAGPITIVR